ncbi:hypothetical protein CLAM6_28140 [Cobetia sp. AM6]|nr:hypothetical protein CLAM6_28140 [Cobetia sp. AM6]
MLFEQRIERCLGCGLTDGAQKHGQREADRQPSRSLSARAVMIRAVIVMTVMVRALLPGW